MKRFGNKDCRRVCKFETFLKISRRLILNLRVLASIDTSYLHRYIGIRILINIPQVVVDGLGHTWGHHAIDFLPKSLSGNPWSPPWATLSRRTRRRRRESFCRKSSPLSNAEDWVLFALGVVSINVSSRLRLSFTVKSQGAFYRANKFTWNRNSTSFGPLKGLFNHNHPTPR